MKKIISAVAAAALLVSAVTIISASAADVTSCEFVLTPDKSAVHPGETVTYTFSIVPNGDVYALQAYLELPKGFALVENSSKLVDGVKEQLKWDDISVTESDKLIFSGFTALTPFTNAAELKIATFICAVNSEAETGSLSLSRYYVLNSNMDAPAELTTKFLPVTIPGLKKVAAKASTCKEPGNNEYYVCDDNCGRVYKDADRKIETTVAAETLPFAHNFISETISADYLKSEANCQSPAVYYKRCVNCGEKGTETFTSGEKNPEKHTGNTEIRNKKDATCKEPGYTGDTYCKDCGEKISSGEVTSAEHKGGKATCTKKAICEFCGEEYGELDPNNHGETELRNAVEATASNEGYTGDKHCKDCGTLVEKGNAIPKLDPTTPPDDKPSTPITPNVPSTPTTPDTPNTPSTSDTPSTPNTPAEKKGSVIIETQLGENVPKMEIITSPDALADILLTSEEQELFKDGYNVRVILAVDNVDISISDSEKSIATNALDTLEDYKTGQYYDIKLYKVISGKKHQVAVTDKPITVAIDIPDALRDQNREYKVVRIHDGKADILNDRDYISNTITIESDLFSTYAIVYRDKAASDTDFPYTGIESPLPLLITIGAIALLVCILLFFTTGRNGLSEEKKEYIFAQLIAWGKRGGKVRSVIALALISMLLVFYYGIGMKTSDNRKQL